VPGVSAALRDPMWQAPALGGSPQLHATLSAARGGRVLFSNTATSGSTDSGAALDDNDARFVEIYAGGPTRIALTNPDGTALGASRVRLALLRVR